MKASCWNPAADAPAAGSGIYRLICTFISFFFLLSSAAAFEGRITVTLTRAGDAQELIYTAGTNFLRVELADTNYPHARDIVNLQSGEITLLFPHNRSFVRFKPVAENGSPIPQAPAVPPPGTSGAGPNAGAGTQPMPALPAMPPLPMEKVELTNTGDTTNLLGYACARYELKQRGMVMEIWATEQLLPFQPYVENQPHRFGPRMMEEQWSGLVAGKKLFPMRAILKFENGPERLRFEVKSVTPEKLKKEDGTKLFQPPEGYMEVQALPF